MESLESCRVGVCSELVNLQDNTICHISQMGKLGLYNDWHLPDDTTVQEL